MRGHGVNVAAGALEVGGRAVADLVEVHRVPAGRQAFGRDPDQHALWALGQGDGPAVLAPAPARVAVAVVAACAESAAALKAIARVVARIFVFTLFKLLLAVL